MKNCEIESSMKVDAKITQQKGHRRPIQLQKQVDKEIEKLFKQEHIEKVDKIQNDVFIEPTVKNINEDKSLKIA